jgi:hypothetical protein
LIFILSRSCQRAWGLDWCQMMMVMSWNGGLDLGHRDCGGNGRMPKESRVFGCQLWYLIWREFLKKKRSLAKSLGFVGCFWDQKHIVAGSSYKITGESRFSDSKVTVQRTENMNLKAAIQDILWEQFAIPKKPQPLG